MANFEKFEKFPIGPNLVHSSFSVILVYKTAYNLFLSERGEIDEKRAEQDSNAAEYPKRRFAAVASGAFVKRSRSWVDFQHFNRLKKGKADLVDELTRARVDRDEEIAQLKRENESLKMVLNPVCPPLLLISSVVCLFAVNLKFLFTQVSLNSTDIKINITDRI